MSHSPLQLLVPCFQFLCLFIRTDASQLVSLTLRSFLPSRSSTLPLEHSSDRIYAIAGKAITYNFTLHFPACDTKLVIQPQHTFKAFCTSYVDPSVPSFLSQYHSSVCTSAFASIPFSSQLSWSKTSKPNTNASSLKPFSIPSFPLSTTAHTKNKIILLFQLPWHSVSYSAFCILLVVMCLYV